MLKRKNGKIKLKRVVRFSRGNPAGIALTGNGKRLIVADGLMVGFLDVHRLESRKRNPFLGFIRDVKGPGSPGSVYLKVTPDDRFVFVSDELAHQVSIIDLDKARRTRFSQSSLVGSVSVGIGPVGLAFSRDNRYLFVTSELWPRFVPRLSPPHGRRKSPPKPRTVRGAEGAVSVVSVAEAARSPNRAVIDNVPAGRSPVRAELARGGGILYVTARASNALLAFDSDKLIKDSKHALIASVPVGAAPVGLAIVDHGRAVIVANSSRFGGCGGQDLTVVGVSGIRRAKAAVEGTIPAGKFPRELHTTADGRTLLLTNFGSSQLEIIDLARLQSLLKPAAPLAVRSEGQSFGRPARRPAFRSFPCAK